LFVDFDDERQDGRWSITYYLRSGQKYILVGEAQPRAPEQMVSRETTEMLQTKSGSQTNPSNEKLIPTARGIAGPRQYYTPVIQ
jgi:hypothetical protein